MEFSGGTQHLQYYQPPVSSDGRLFVHKSESPHTNKPNPETPQYLNVHCKLHEGTKLDYLFFESSKMLEGSEIQLLKNLCEQERTEILTILMLSMENPRLTGYMVTGNRSMFLSTDGSLAWLYHCPLMRSPPHVINQCYDKIPIFYKNASFFVDPITRQSYPHAQVQNCSDRIKNLFQFDMEYENSWFTITPTRTQETPCSVRTKGCDSCIQKSFWWSRRCWNLHTSTVIWILGQYPYQRCFKENFIKFLLRTPCPQHSNSWTRTILLLCPRNGILCGQHDFPQLFQKSVYGHVWISCLCFGILWNIFLLLPVYQAHRRYHSYDLTTHES